MALSFRLETNLSADYQDEAIHWSAIYVAPASVLPEDLLSVAGCHDLTYLQPVQQLDGDSILVHAAPLSHRLGMPGKYFTCVLSASAFNSALVYDRRLAGQPTCDLRELVEERAAQTAPVAAIAPVEDCTDEEEEADLAPLPTIFVSRAMIHESLETLEVMSRKGRYVQTALLHAILQTLAMHLKDCRSAPERRRLQKQCDQVCAVQQWRRQRREKGHGWQRVVTLEESWHQGRAGWNLIVGVPVSQAA